MVERAHRVPTDRQVAHVEELDLGQRAAARLRQHLQCRRALHLEAVELALARRVDRGALVALELHVVSARLCVVLHPVVSGGTADEAHPVLGVVEEDAVADHVAVLVAGDELLRLVDREVLEGVDAESRQQVDHVRPLDVQVGHVMRLVEQGARLPPRDLLVAPVRELGRNLRIDVRPDLGVPHQIHRIAGRLQQFFQASLTHLRVASFGDRLQGSARSQRLWSAARSGQAATGDGGVLLQVSRSRR